jgi:uncharacterized protein (TIGR02145 family)
MKNIVILIIAFISVFNANAQAPQKFNYQGIARNAQGEAIANQAMALKIWVLSAADAEVPDFEEVHQVKTNEFGLYTLEIGAGEAITGTMSSVKWETGNKYIRVAIDPQGGNNFELVGTNQLLSVPYALYSDKAGIAKKVSSTLRSGQANYISKFDSTGSSSAEIQSVIYDNGNNIGIGTTNPLSKIHVQANGASLQGMRIQNLNPTGVGRFLFYNDSTNSYGTMTKYGSTFPGQPSGLTNLYPYANLWTFGNNALIPNDGTGRTLISSAGNVGISYVKNGAFKLKFHADYNTGNVGIGGNATPRAKIHLSNTDSTYMNLMLSNTVTGHIVTDGLNIALENKEATITNREIGSLSLGTLNTERMRITSSGNIGIGTINPNASAITEMSSTTQGFLPPRMTTIQRNAINTPTNGLIIFNLSTGCLNYCFGGAWYEWCGNYVATVGTISTINCAGAIHTGTLTATLPASGVSSNINYTGGNGGVHGGQTVNSTGVTGLTATLAPGNFATGAGTLTYTISGTPANNGTASFAIIIGGKTCTLNRTVALPQPSVSSLSCGTASNTGTLQQGNVANGVISAIPYTGGNGIAYTTQTVSSTGVSGLTATLTAGTLAIGNGNLVYTIAGTPSSSGTANFTISFGGQTCTLALSVASNATYPAGTVFCNNTPTAVVDVTNPVTGRTWMDRNLGASQVATSSTDSLAYGDLYQWGRGADGHQCRNSQTTTILSSTNQPGHGNFIKTNTTPYDWLSLQNNNLWQGVVGINMPCPNGYRLPTEYELQNERLSWSSLDAIGAYLSPLKLTLGGIHNTDGNIYGINIQGYFWTSTVSTTYCKSISNSNNFSNWNNYIRGVGLSVRCIKEITGNIASINCGSITNTGTLINSYPANGVSGTIPYTGGNGGFYPSTLINSTGVLGLTANISQGLFANGSGIINYTITGTPTSGGVASFVLNIGGQSCSFTLNVLLTPNYPVGSVFCNGQPTIVVDVTNPITGKTWMDRNLGATQAAISSTDSLSYGDMYQWGRGADGHQCRSSANTNTLSANDQPNNSNFILVSTAPTDWRSPQNNNLWQGVNGINNPCPIGYRLPTDVEFSNEQLSWSSNDMNGAYNSQLKMPLAGFRYNSVGLFNNVGYDGFYWTSTTATNSSRTLTFGNGYGSINGYFRALGFSVRCIKN